MNGHSSIFDNSPISKPDLNFLICTAFTFNPFMFIHCMGDDILIRVSLKTIYLALEEKTSCSSHAPPRYSLWGKNPNNASTSVL